VLQVSPRQDVEDLEWLLLSTEFLAPAATDAGRISQLQLLERLGNVVAALRAAVTVGFAASQALRHVRLGVRAADVGRDTNAQLALARRVSPHQAAADRALAAAMVSRFPRLFARMRAGLVGEAELRIVVGECRQLPVELAQVADSRLDDMYAEAGDEPLGRGRVEHAARRIAIELDQAAYVARLSHAAGDRRVSVRPAPDAMVALSALLPLSGGVQSWGALDRRARQLRGAGDSRSLDQLRADLLVERLTGRQVGAMPDVEIQLVIDSDTLLGDGDQPAEIRGYGPIPATIARQLAGAGLERDEVRAAGVFLRRLFTDPVDDTVRFVDDRRRIFHPSIQRLVRARDRHCRMPGCEAPIRHIDHIHAHNESHDSGPGNAAGACEAWNYVKQMPGWRVRPTPRRRGDPHVNPTMIITTPTGHTYTSTVPAVFGTRRRREPARRRRR
jgi:hypothetical protein